MKYLRELFSVLFVVSFCCALSSAQTSSTEVPTVVPQLVNYAGKAVDAQGKPVSGIAGVTFSIYKDQYEGTPLWMETQNVTADAEGNYSVQLGATKPQGLPLDLFSSGEARWLGVRINNGEEQPRVLLLSVPYALKAADAQTLGGLPASAFVLAAPASGGLAAEAGAASSPAGVEPALAGTGTTDYVPLWTPNGTTLGSSVLFQSGTGSTAKVGINSTTPASTLDVNGAVTARGNLSLPAIAAATTTGGRNSQPLTFTASAYNSGTGSAVNQTFRWQAQPASNNTSSPTGTFNLLFGAGSSSPTETGLHIASNGQITFAPGQTFPGAGGGVSSVGLSAPSSDFTVSGSPVTTSGTLALNWTVAPDDFDIANAIVKRDSSGSFQAGTIIAFGSSGGAAALVGSDNSSDGVGAVQGSSSNGIGVYGFSGSTSNSSNNYGVFGTGPIGGGFAASASDGIGVFGSSSAGVGVSAFGATGVFSVGTDTGVYGVAYLGVEGFTDSTSGGWGVYGESQGAGVGGGFYNTSTGDALYASNQAGGYAAFFDGNVDVDGKLSSAGGSIEIDHPLDPANKYLYHSSVESPDMKNIYDGNVTTDGSGLATVTLPDWFEALNSDFRYQLTVIGQFAQAMVASEISDHQFTIKTDKPNVKVSWQVTGIRQDAWANAHRIPVEESKAPADQGLYLHPELFGAPAEKSIALAHHPMALKPRKQDPRILKLQEQQATKLKASTK
ncbi:MAG: hypothetical protein WBC78_04195 [Candidatus Sulfotelmatobacter sp.]